jgi:hypothetical protein
MTWLGQSERQYCVHLLKSYRVYVRGRGGDGDGWRWSRTARCRGVRRQSRAELASTHVWWLALSWRVSFSLAIPPHRSSTVSSMTLVFEICLHPPYVASVPRRHLSAMCFDHVTLQVHLSAKNDEFLFKANTLLARVVRLREVDFLEAD